MSESLNVGRTGKRNLLPSKQAQRDYLRDMRAAADAGDVLAMGLLVGLAKLEEHHTEFKVKCASGWAGEAGDPKAAIIAAIRANAPYSEQLPEFS
jgi:hypothetical protein